MAVMQSLPRLVVALTCAVALVAFARAADAQEEPEDSVAMSHNRGLSIGLGPTLLLPMRTGGPYGAGLSLDARYGIKAGPTVVAPGGMVAGYAISSRLVGVAMPTLRFTVPVGPLAPYVLGGIGGGGITHPGEGGVAFLAGGGLMVHFGRVFALGLEATYQTITTTEFSSVALGPLLAFGG
jgi:hypothetical protein